MRIVLTAQPAYSHLVPLALPAGRVLQDAGTIAAYAREIRGRRTWSFWWE